jgi:hypothetical protein
VAVFSTAHLISLFALACVNPRARSMPSSWATSPTPPSACMGRRVVHEVLLGLGWCHARCKQEVVLLL